MNLGELPSVGDTLSGKYRLTRKLGQGGMGAVYEATHLRLRQRVAIKVVLPEVAERPELAYRFENEARAAARLHGPHTARVTDVDTTREGVLYLVMELLEGHSLRDELAQRGPLPADEAVRYVREACEGVDEAHRAGIVHRDIKPANLFLCVEGEHRLVKVVDFGIAKAHDEAEHTDPGYHTATNAPLGTYRYMSPEQAKSPRSVDGRTDVWSLGVVLYQLLSGKTPFQGEGALGVVYAIATQAPPPLRATRPDVSEALVAVIERALCKELEGRYQTVRELSDALAPFDAPRLSALPRSPSMPALTPFSGVLRPAPSSSPPVTPALGLTPPQPSELGYEATQPHALLSPAASGGVVAPLAGPAQGTPTATPSPTSGAPQPAGRWWGVPDAPAATPSQAPGEGVPNDSVAKNHAVPIKSKRPGAGAPPLRLWLVGATALLVGATTLGVQVARRRSDTTALTPAPQTTKPSQDTSAAKATPSASATSALERPPPLIAPAEGPAPGTPMAKSEAGHAPNVAPIATSPSVMPNGAGPNVMPTTASTNAMPNAAGPNVSTARPSVAGPNASAARPAARPRPTKAPAGKAAAEPVTSVAPPPDSKKRPDPEIFE